MNEAGPPLDEDAGTTGPAVPKKTDWPRTEHGTIDWEQAFEAPDTGLIALVEAAVSAEGLLACCRVIVHALFSRADDSQNRLDFERRIDDALAAEVAAESGAGMADACKLRVVDLLREIKEIRVERAAFHVARLRSEMAEDTAPPDLATTTAAIESHLDISPEDAFVEAVCRFVGSRLEALREGVTDGPVAGKPAPFPVSSGFVERFDGFIRTQMAPDMRERCRTFTLQAEKEPPAERVRFILESMEDRRSHQLLWSNWQEIWEHNTGEQEMPRKPKEEKKGLLGKLKRKPDQPSWMGEALTMEEWEDEVDRIERANARAAENWAALTAPGEDFQAPKDDDRRMLMNLFARTPGALTKQIKAIHQIGEQGGNAGKVFADYQQGKDIDLPLLCACARRPDLFLEGGLLKDFMRGFPDTMKTDRFPLTTRFFRDFL